MVLPHGTGVVRISRLNLKSHLSGSLLLQRGVLRVEFAPNPPPSQLLRDLCRGAATHKWIEHHVARAGACENAWLDECRRELSLPPENVSLAECFNSSKDNGNEQDSAGALHLSLIHI